MIPEADKFYLIVCKDGSFRGVGKCISRSIRGEGQSGEGLYIFELEDSWNMFSAEDIIEEIV